MDFSGCVGILAGFQGFIMYFLCFLEVFQVFGLILVFLFQDVQVLFRDSRGFLETHEILGFRSFLGDCFLIF